MDLDNRIALVTGASRGIGRAVAVELARAGAHVAVNYHERHAAAEEVVREITALGRKAVALPADVADEVSVQTMIERANQELGPVDVLVNNAGIARPAALADLDAATFDLTVRVNLRSAFLVTSALVPGMRQRRFGRILFVSSVAAHIGGIIGPHYAASKAGLLGLMHGYASQLAAEGITANVIAPALIATEMVADNPRARPDAIPVRRFGTAEEVAKIAVAVLANGYLTGQTINVDGGLHPS
jgi:3-oxoacyl-[acyl-carrier protein] reductase